MAKTFEWDYAAAGEIFLKSDGIAQFCEEQAARMTRATGMEYKADVKVGKKRVSARGQTSGDNPDLKTRYTRKIERDPETGWPICPKCGKAHAHCNCYRRKRKG